MIAGLDFDSYCAYFSALVENPGPDDPPILSATIRFRAKNESATKFAFEAVKRIPHALHSASRVTWVGRCTDVYIERATGQSRRSDYPLARVQGALTCTLHDLGIHVWEIQTGEWKKKVTKILDGRGNGNAPKDMVRAAVIAHGFELPPEADDHNLYDAAAIAIVAAAENAKAAA